MDYQILTSKINHLAYKSIKERFSFQDFDKQETNNSISFFHLNIRALIKILMSC